MKKASLPIHCINTDNELDEVLSHLMSVEEASVDLEFDKNRYRYGFNLCLVQIATAEQCYVIDPLSKELTVNRLFPFFEDPSIQIIAFAFNEDLRLLHSLGCFPKNIYDISTAAKLMDYPPVSLKNILNDVLGIEISKAAQTSNWFKRPLSEGQINYAAQDVLFLSDLKNALLNRPAKPIVEEWIRQENHSLETTSYADEQNAAVYKEKDKSGLTEYEWFVYRNLLELREKWAEKYNRPGYQVLDKNYLREVARDVSAGRSWQRKWGIFKPFNTSHNKDRLKNAVRDISQEARELGLSKSKREVPPHSREQIAAFKQERDRKEEIKMNLFDPVKRLITEDFGEHAATFILSNKLILKIIDGHANELLEYRKDLLLDYADKIGISLDEFLATA